MEKINEAIQKLISVSPLVQNCYVSSSGQTASTDLLAHLVKSDNPWVNYAEYNKLKPYQHIILFGDALMSAVYTAYAYHSLHKDYGICPDVTLIHLDDIGNRKTAFCAQKILSSLGVAPTYCYADDVYECRPGTLLIIPQHRALMVQEHISGDNLGIYTIPGGEVILGDRDLSVFYIDESVHILRRRKQHPECVQWWSEAIRNLTFGDKDAYAETVKEEITALIANHAPRIQQFYC